MKEEGQCFKHGNKIYDLASFDIAFMILHLLFSKNSEIQKLEIPNTARH